MKVFIFVPIFNHLNTPPYRLVNLSNLIFLDVHTITIKVMFSSSSHHLYVFCVDLYVKLLKYERNHRRTDPKISADPLYFLCEI
jgi:hypothetical protein